MRNRKSSDAHRSYRPRAAYSGIPSFPGTGTPARVNLAFHVVSYRRPLRPDCVKGGSAEFRSVDILLKNHLFVIAVKSMLRSYVFPQ